VHPKQHPAGSPPFDLSDKAHGRIERRRLSLRPVDPLGVDFPYARTALAVQSYRELTGESGSWETRYYLSSRDAEQMGPEQWLDAIRGHWAGVENRLHWRKDACLFEDKTRSRNPNIVGNLMLLRNATLALFAHQLSHPSLPAFTEAVAADSRLAYALLNKPLC
jgi:predicted transposase YbfD/YdcC